MDPNIDRTNQHKPISPLRGLSIGCGALFLLATLALVAFVTLVIVFNRDEIAAESDARLAARERATQTALAQPTQRPTAAPLTPKVTKAERKWIRIMLDQPGIGATGGDFYSAEDDTYVWIGRRSSGNAVWLIDKRTEIVYTLTQQAVIISPRLGHPPDSRDWYIYGRNYEAVYAAIR